MLNGIDVSEHNGSIDWKRVATAGYTFAFCKATEGATYHDSTFKQNYAGARASGLLRGAYCFARPRTSSALQEADAFVSVVDAVGGFELPPVLDMEDNGGLKSDQLIAWIRTWMNRVKEKTGKQPILYSYTAFIRENGLYGLTDIPLWIADYSSSTIGQVSDWKHWAFWQHTETGSVPGIQGHVDLNYFNGTADDLRRLCGIAVSEPSKPVAPTPKPTPPSIPPSQPVSIPVVTIVNPPITVPIVIPAETSNPPKKGTLSMVNKSNYAALIVTLLGAVKLVLNQFGVDIFSDAQINDIANGVAAVVAVAGPIVMHVFHRKAVASAKSVTPSTPVTPSK